MAAIFDSLLAMWHRYYGRPFQARNKAKGGAFNRDDGGADNLRFTVGDANVLGAFNEAVQGMRVGGIRRIIVGPGPLFYPASGRDARKVVPQPSTFSGERALYFVLENQGLIDKTLLFDLELLRIDK
jgi:FKBP-type peptidyl-prolyl cis-trans isomerase